MKDQNLEISYQSFELKGSNGSQSTYWPAFIIAFGKFGPDQKLVGVEPRFGRVAGQKGFDTPEQAIDEAKRYTNPRYVKDELTVDFDGEGVPVSRLP